MALAFWDKFGSSKRKVQLCFPFAWSDLPLHWLFLSRRRWCAPIYNQLNITGSRNTHAKEGEGRLSAESHDNPDYTAEEHNPCTAAYKHMKEIEDVERRHATEENCSLSKVTMYFKHWPTSKKVLQPDYSRL